MIPAEIYYAWISKANSECNKEISFSLSGASSTNQLSHNNGLALVLFMQSILRLYLVSKASSGSKTPIYLFSTGNILLQVSYILDYDRKRACSSDPFTVHACAIYIQLSQNFVSKNQATTTHLFSNRSI